MIFQFLFINVYAQTETPASGKYTLVKVVSEYFPAFGKKMKVARVNKSDVAKLSEPLSALAAYYSCLGGTNCDVNENNDEVCELTMALGLGIQGSEKQILLLQTWFGDDSVVQRMINQGCYLSISGSNNFSNFSSLSFKQTNDTVFINYELDYYSSGSSSSEKFNEIVVINDGRIKFIKRELGY